MKQFTEKEIEQQMRANHCTRDEAIDILAWDYDIEHGDTEKGAMTAEQKKMVRALTNSGRKSTGTAKRERKVDEDKKFIHDCIRIMFEGMHANGRIEDLTCKNETEVSFRYNGAEYSVKLTKHRAPKN